MFFDMSGFEDEKIDALPFGAACFAEVGNHVILSPPRPISAEGVTFKLDGLADVSLERDSDDLFEVYIDSNSIMSTDGGDELSVFIEYDSGLADSFPAATLETTTPAAVTGYGLERITNGSLKVTWDKSESSYFEIVLQSYPSASGPGGRLRCMLLDDGCHRIPSAGIEWLRAAGGPSVRMILKRHKIVHEVPQKDSLVELDIARSMELDLDLE